MTIPQMQFGFFLAFKHSVWPFRGLCLALLGFFFHFHLANLLKGIANLAGIEVEATPGFLSKYAFH